MAGKHFLVIEDNKDDADLIKVVFKSLKHCDAALCRNLSEAKSYLRGDGSYNDRSAYPFPNAVLCDFKLVGENATDFLRWIKSDEALCKMPVYILTGGVSPYDAEQAKKFGAVAVLNKPPDFLDFKQMLGDLAAKICESD